MHRHLGAHIYVLMSFRCFSWKLINLMLNIALFPNFTTSPLCHLVDVYIHTYGCILSIIKFLKLITNSTYAIV